MRDEGLQRINDLYTKWHGKEKRPHQRVPGWRSRRDLVAGAAAGGPRLRREARPRLHDSPVAEHSRSRLHGAAPRGSSAGFLARADFLSPRLFAAHCRYVDDDDIGLLGRSGTIISHQANMAANRGVDPADRQTARGGCPIANGTDNNTNDLFGVMKVALLTERVSRNERSRAAASAGRHARGRHEGRRASRASGRGARIARGRQEGRPDRAGHAGRAPRAGRAESSPRGPTTVRRRTSSRAWSTASSSCATARFSRSTRTGLLAEADKVGRRIWTQVQASGPISIPGRPRQSRERELM